MYRAIETPSESNYDVRSEEIVRSYCVGRNSAGGGARPAGNEPPEQPALGASLPAPPPSVAHCSFSMKADERAAATSIHENVKPEGGGDDSLVHLQSVTEDLLRQLAEREVEMEEVQERHIAELRAKPRAPWADPCWMKHQPGWLQLLVFVVIATIVIMLPLQ